MCSCDGGSNRAVAAPCGHGRRPHPRFILLGEALVEPTDRAADFERLPEAFEPLPPRMSRACASHEHLRQPFGNVGFVAAIPVKHLRMEVTFPVSGHFEILNASGGSYQVTGIGPIAITPAMGSAFSP